MRFKTTFVLLNVSGLCAAALIACSSSTTPPVSTVGTDAGGDASSATDGASASDAGGDFGSWGKTCTNPINTGTGGGGGTGQEGGAIAEGGVDPACTGEYDLCANIAGAVQCTKPCTYTGTSGPMANPKDCPNPPTNGNCTPRGFCQ
jgi:hypothetical protein